MNISVIICSHNPESEKLNRVLDSLKSQTEPISAWELLMVDNCSAQNIQQKFDFSWHPNVKHIQEPQLGLSIARARGIMESSGELLIIVDDDSPLFPNYITTAKRIALENPHIACFGGNQLPLNPKIHVESKYRLYLEMIGYRVVNAVRISNMYIWETTPAGAGMVIRASIARIYAKTVFNNTLHAVLGRRGDSLMSSQDVDMAYNAIDQGFFNAVFPELSIYHLSIDEHLNDDYIIQRYYYNVYSSNLLNYIRFGILPGRIPRSKHYLFQLLRVVRGHFFEYHINTMCYRANVTLRKEIQQGIIKR